MREILFRGKLNNGKWAYGNLEVKKQGMCIVTPNDMIIGSYGQVIPETVGQYTGLTDKNGTKIFEWDIVESRASKNKEDWKMWLIGFSDGSFCFNRKIPKKRKRRYEQNLLCEDEVELYGLVIVGNIHDNPELLKGGE